METYSYIFLVCLIVCLGFVSCIVLNAKRVEKKYFNGGVCLDCKTPLERINEEGARLRSYYCPNCFSIITIFFRVDKNVNVSQHYSDVEEAVGEMKEVEHI
jgi:DNA-directed RNA polymerase subunit RPC12/RpoP